MQPASFGKDLPAEVAALYPVDRDHVLVGMVNGVIGIATRDGFEELAHLDRTVTDLVRTATAVYVGVLANGERELWRVSPKVGATRIGVINLPAITTTHGGELVYARNGQLVVRADDDHERELIDLPGPGSRHEVMLTHRTYGPIMTWVDDLRAIRARVAMARTLACTATDVFYDPSGDTTAHARICSVPLAGGEPRIWLEGHDEPTASNRPPTSRRFSTFAVQEAVLAVIAIRATNTGKRLAATFERVSLETTLALAKQSLTAEVRYALHLVGDLAVWLHRAGSGGHDVLEGVVSDTAPQRIAERQGYGLCVSQHGIWFGHGMTIQFVARDAIVPSALSRRAQEVVDTIRAAAGAYEVTRVGGQLAIAIAAHGGRVIKVINEAELVEIERAMTT